MGGRSSLIGQRRYNATVIHARTLKCGTNPSLSLPGPMRETAHRDVHARGKRNDLVVTEPRARDRRDGCWPGGHSANPMRRPAVVPRKHPLPWRVLERRLGGARRHARIRLVASRREATHAYRLFRNGRKASIKNPPPYNQFLVERQSRVRWTRGGQYQGLVAGCGNHRRESSRRFPVKTDLAQRRRMLAQRIEVVRLRIAYRRIETALAMTCIEHIPNADAVCKHANQSIVIGQFVQRSLAKHRPQQPPKLIDVLVNLTSGADRPCRSVIACVFCNRERNPDLANRLTCTGMAVGG